MTTQHVNEAARKIPVVHEADIVVVGGGCTGVFAAVRAARLGLKVAIVEKQNCFGGAATAGNVNVWHSLRDTTETREIIGGLTLEVMERLKKRGAIMDGPNKLARYALNTEELKIELDELVNENQIQPFLHTFFATVVRAENRLTGIIVENKNGRQAILGQQFVDASGDGDVARRLGLPMQEVETEELQPPTTCAKILGMHTLKDFNWQQAVKEHGPEFNLEPDWGWGGPIPGMPNLQMRADTHLFHTDVSDAEQLTHAELEGRRKIRAIMDIIRKYGPTDSAIALADLAATIGARETRRIRAEYILTGDDVLSGRQFEDAIANGTYPVDIHHSDSPGITFRYLDGTEKVIPERGASSQFGRWRDPLPDDPTCYTIPFRSLINRQVPNLIFAGRMLAADKIAFSAVRVMVNLNQTGEAAGVAAALALKEGRDVALVDPMKVREWLTQGGSIILE